MKKILAFVLMTAVLVCPVLASGDAQETSAEPAAAEAAPEAAVEAAEAPFYALEVVEPATCTENGVSAYVDSSTGEVLFTFETAATGHVPSANAPTCTDAVVCLECGEVLEPAIGHAYTYQYDAVRNADGSFASFGTWKCDNCGAVVDATEGNAVYYYGAAEPVVEEPAADASAEPAAEASSEAESSAEPAREASAEPAEESGASAEAADETTAEPAAEEAAAEEASEPANPNYDPAAHNWAGIELVLVLVIVVIGAVLMLSFGKKKG